MRHDLALDIKIGDTVYNCFMDKLIVTSIHKKVSDTGRFSKIIVGTIGEKLQRTSYDSEDIYLSDLYGESDDEKSWVEWAKNNKDFFEAFDHIETMKEIYKTGFCNGFEYKRNVTHEEMMQK